MTANRRISMNTSLKNARIFDDDSWDSEQLTIRLNIKSEVIDNDYLSDNANFGSFPDHVKDDIIPAIAIKQEKPDNDINPLATRDKIKLEQIKQEAPEAIEKETDVDRFASEDSSSQTCRSLKRTVAKRDSPYSRLETPEDRDSSEKGDSHKNARNGKKRKFEYESDPQVLARRQKQIDFGKNTIGYDNYTKNFANSKRSPDDPVTPNKYWKYSRRAWDGLIKRWRLRLHKYD